MKTCIYFTENPGLLPGAGRLAAGYGFTPAGQWRPLPLPEGAEGLILDDRFPPRREGLAAARRALTAWEGLVVFDLEGPRLAPFAELIGAAASGGGAVVPPRYAALPHRAVLVGPWTGGLRFEPWLEARRRAYGPLLLDAAPLRRLARPGGPWRLWPGELPGQGHPCPGLGCLHCRRPDGSVLFWDSRRTLLARLEAAGVAALLFDRDWLALQ